MFRLVSALVLPALFLILAGRPSQAQNPARSTPERSAPTTGVQPPATALLVGLRYETAIPAPLPYYVVPSDSLSRQVYRTLLIVRPGSGQPELAAELPSLVVPRRGGLWKVDAKRSAYNSWVEDFLVSAPIGQRARLSGIQAYNGEYCRGHRIQLIHFAGPSYLGIEQRSAGYCEDAAHPWFSSTLAVVPVDSTTHIGLPVSDVLGRAGRDAFAAGARRFLSRLRSDEERAQFYTQLDEANWTVVRRAGRWQLRGRLDTEEVADARTADFDVDLRPPASVVGHDELYPSWERIRAFAPNARDAVSSPARDLLVILRPDRLTVHPVRNDGIGAATMEIAVPANATLIMAQWTNSNAAVWARTLRSHAEATPLGWQRARP